MDNKAKIVAGCVGIIAFVAIVVFLNVDAQNTTEYVTHTSCKWARNSEAHRKNEETGVFSNFTSTMPAAQIDPISDDVCENFVKFFNNKEFEEGAELDLKEIFNGETDDDFLEKLRRELYSSLEKRSYVSSDNTNYYNYIITCSKKYYTSAHYDDDYIYLEVKKEKQDIIYGD